MEYQICRHPRARHVRLRLDRLGRLTVTVPQGVKRSEVDALVRRHAEWIESQRARVDTVRDPATDGPRPERLDLEALGQRWRIEYADPACTRTGDGHIRVDGSLDDTGVHQRLLTWLKRHARNNLEPVLADVANACRLEYGKVSWRNQKARWGSCSRNGNLSLNVRLLFVTPELARFVFAHELCHTVHPNHGPDFRRLLYGIEPDGPDLDRRLDEAWPRLPLWLDA